MTGAAFIFAILSLVNVLFQLALAFGAPWGALAMGGRFAGRFPPWLRIAAVVQAGMIAFFAFVVLGRAEVVSPPPPAGLFWMVVCFTAVTAVLNLITPSIPERRLWGPVALVMLVCVIRVAVG